MLSIITLSDRRKMAVLPVEALGLLDNASASYCFDEFEIMLVSSWFLEEVTASADKAVKEGDSEGGAAGYALRYIVDKVEVGFSIIEGVHGRKVITRE